MKPSHFISKTAIGGILGVLLIGAAAFSAVPALAKERAEYRVYNDHRSSHKAYRDKHRHHNSSRERYREKNYNRSIHKGFGYHNGHRYRDHGHRHPRYWKHNSHYYDRHHKSHGYHQNRHYKKRYYRKSRHSDVGEIIVGSLILGAVVHELTDNDHRRSGGMYNQAAQIPVQRSTTRYPVEEPVEVIEYAEEFLRDKDGRCYSVDTRSGRRILTETDSRRCI